MTYERFMQDVYERVHQELVLVLKDLSEKDLDYRPGPQSNSIGWLLWHSIRSEDRMNADLFGEEQLWIRGQWYAKFNRAADAKDTGMRHTNEQVAAFRSPPVQTYLDYAEAVFARTREYMQTRLSEEDLERKIASPTLGTTATVAERLFGTLNNLQHIGQAGYVKGMLKGIGWYGR